MSEIGYFICITLIGLQSNDKIGILDNHHIIIGRIQTALEGFDNVRVHNTTIALNEIISVLGNLDILLLDINF